MYGEKMMIPIKEYTIPLGIANLKKKGNDLTIVSFGKIIKIALEVALELEKKNISIEIIDLRTIKPLDYNPIINSIKKTNKLLILEEAWPFASIAS